MAEDITIKPVHDQLQSEGSNTTFTSLFNFYQPSAKAFLGLNSEGSDSTFTSLLGSNFAYYVTGAITPLTVSACEYINATDEFFMGYGTLLEEDVNITDSMTTSSNGNTIRMMEELFDSSDDTLINFATLSEDVINSTDEFSSFSALTFQELINATDSLITAGNAILSFIDVVNITDDMLTYQSFDGIDQMKIQLVTGFVTNDQIKASIGQLIKVPDSLVVGVIPHTLISVTNASSASNPFSPTIVLGGVIYVSNPSTALPNDYNRTQYTNFVQWDAAQIGQITACDLINFNFSFDYAGGSFSTTSVDPLVAGGEPENLGTQVNIFGFTGTINGFGGSYQRGSIGIKTSGIFGNPKMDQQFTYQQMQSNSVLKILSNQTLLQANPNLWLSAHAAMRGIADIVGVKITYAVPDVPILNFTAQVGMTAMEALSSLAAANGASLRWDGGDNYLVAYPNFSRGVWEVPHWSLVAGAEFEKLKNVTYAGYGSYLVYVPPGFNPGSNQYGGGGSNGAPQVQTLTKIRSLMTDKDPPAIFDLPQDYDKVWIQILIAEGQDTGGSSDVGLSNFVTTDPAQWFEFNVARLGVQYVTRTNVGGATIPQVRIDSHVFPSNTAVKNGNFVMTIGFTRKDFSGLFSQASSYSLSIQNYILGATQNNYRFYPIQRATITSYFFGSIPLPGMLGKVTMCDGKVISGIIESVSFNHPGTVSVTLAQYGVIDFISPLSSL